MKHLFLIYTFFLLFNFSYSQSVIYKYYRISNYETFDYTFTRIDSLDYFRVEIGFEKSTSIYYNIFCEDTISFCNLILRQDSLNNWFVLKNKSYIYDPDEWEQFYDNKNKTLKNFWMNGFDATLNNFEILEHQYYKNEYIYKFKVADLFAPKSWYTIYWFDPIKGIIAFEFGQTVYIREDFY
jgi:hypothetical protein